MQTDLTTFVDEPPETSKWYDDEPWADPRVLDYLYNERSETFSTREIAAEVFDGRVSHERIRVLLKDEYDLMGETCWNFHKQYEGLLDDEDEDEYDDYAKYTLAGQAAADDPTDQPLVTDGGRR